MNATLRLEQRSWRKCPQSYNTGYGNWQKESCSGSKDRIKKQEKATEYLQRLKVNG